MIKYKKICIVLFGLIALLVVWLYINHSVKAAKIENPSVWVSAVKVKPSQLERKITAVGTLFTRSVEITPEVAGHINAILFQDGVEVKAEMPLFKFEDAIYQSKYELAQAKFSYSKNKYERIKILSTKGIVSKQALDEAEAEYKEKKADADESRVMLSKIKLTAPFDGILSRSKVNIGEFVTIGQSLVTLTDTTHLRVEYHVPETFLRYIKPGQPVQITTPAFPNKKFFGKVAYIAPTLNSDNRSLSLYAEIENPKHELLSGMFVNVEHSLGNSEHILLIPARSLVPGLEGEQVFKIVDRKAQPVPVEVGTRLAAEIQIVKGLSANDIVITDGQLKVKKGLPVEFKLEDRTS
ncbi:MAG: efflux RND transporter periplasmic adaptor subunit [Gammaproteobacteria bacterium]|nr:efflux RND transporter periplasmic adaptor subunit [Gammaproteobacteria bacterium]